MRSADPYRDTARELLQRAGNHPNAQQRAKLETTAAEWLRLADEADRFPDQKEVRGDAEKMVAYFRPRPTGRRVEQILWKDRSTF